MREARLYVDFNNMITDNLVPLSESDDMENSNGKTISLRAGLKVKIYSNDLSSCHQTDNLIAAGVVELNNHPAIDPSIKWNCRIDKRGIYNESQQDKKEYGN